MPRPPNVEVEIGKTLERLEVLVRDDGRGGAHPAEGSGLAGLLDRVRTLGGELEVDSGPGYGTTLKARMPCV